MKIFHNVRKDPECACWKGITNYLFCKNEIQITIFIFYYVFRLRIKLKPEFKISRLTLCSLWHKEYFFYSDLASRKEKLLKVFTYLDEMRSIYFNDQVKKIKIKIIDDRKNKIVIIKHFSRSKDFPEYLKKQLPPRTMWAEFRRENGNIIINEKYYIEDKFIFNHDKSGHVIFGIKEQWNTNNK